MQFSSNQVFHSGIRDGSSSGLQRYIAGLPHLIVLFRVYLSVMVNSSWDPHQLFLFGRYLKSKSSKIT